MKYKQITAALLSALLLTGCQFGDFSIEPYIPDESLSTAESSESAEVAEVAETHPLQSESAGDDAVYTQVYETLSRGEKQVSLQGIQYSENPGDIIREIVPKMQQDHPELFWLSYSWSATGIGTSVTVDFNFYSDVNEAELPAMRERFDQAVNEVISQVPAGATDFEKIVFVHDWLVYHTHYDFAGKNSADTGGLYSTAYGALVNGSAVCAGYTDAFLYLMHLLGIEAGYVSGYGKGESHAWNYVRLDGEYYWIDVTWDDPAEEGKALDEIRHCYLLVTDDMMLRDHTVTEDPKVNPFIPTCTGTKYNYYRMNNAYIETYSKDAVFDVIRAHPGEKEVEIMFSDYAGYKDAIRELFDESKIFDIATSDWNGGVSYQYNDDMYMLTIILPIPENT